MMKRRNGWLGNIGLMLSSMLIVAGVFAGMILLTILCMHIPGMHEYLQQGIPRIVVAIVLLGIFKVRYQEITIGFKRKNLLTGILLGWLMILYSIENIYIARSQVNWEKALSPQLWDYIFYTIYIMSIALFEEAVMRGVILNKMIQKWGRSKLGIYMAAIMSSLIFGLWHLINLFDAPWLVVTTGAQVIYAFFIGVFFAAIYLRTKNLWTTIILHAIVDFTGCYGELFDETIRQNLISDMSLQSGIFLVFRLSIFFIIGLFYLRKVKEKRGISYTFNLKS